jgi:hypothetical protein
MPKPSVFRASAFGLLGTPFLYPGVAHPNNVAVNCPGKASAPRWLRFLRKGPTPLR